MFSVRLQKILLIGISFLTIVSIFSPIITKSVYGETLQEQLDRVERELKVIQDQKQEIQNLINDQKYIVEGYDYQISRIHGEVQIFQKEIDVLVLQIQELELNIKLLDEEIAKKKKEIDELLVNVGYLEEESKSRIKDNYIKFRMSAGGQVTESNIFKTESINEYFKDSQYITIIQDDTNKMLEELDLLKQRLDLKTKELDEKLKNINKEKEAIEVRRVDLEKRRDEIDQKKASYYAAKGDVDRKLQEQNKAIAAISQEEAEKSSQAESLRQTIFNSFNPVEQAEYVTAGRPIGRQGCTGICTGPHLHFMVAVNNQWQDPCGFLKPGGPVEGCGWGDRLDWPVSGNVTYTSNYGERCFLWNGQNYCDFHLGIDLQAVPLNSPIFAAHAGYAYKSTDSSGANYVIICENTNCNEGLKTGYWHLSSF